MNKEEMWNFILLYNTLFLFLFFGNAGFYGLILQASYPYFSSQNTIKHAQKGKYKKEIDAIIDKSSKVRR